ncbi:MAG: DUF222 domain-containing protein, partial [Candidatus Latescibacteria bacterium]|nr:DUF222 domain-containing protein [bacterium]MBD3424414.1 DUF222 domain-containing protein [Candidatus Latescibacterota bacterium]
MLIGADELIAAQSAGFTGGTLLVKSVRRCAVSVQVSEEISGKIESISMLRAELQSIGSRKLLENLASYNDRERKLKARVLLYLWEIDRRKLYLEEGYSSMFDFCTGQLGYSRSAACRRIKAARCMGKYPEIALMLSNGELSVSTAALISGIINPANRQEVLSRVRGRSYREAEEEVARFRPVPRRPERIKPVFTLRPKVRESKESTPDVGSGKKSVGCSSSDRSVRESREMEEGARVEKEYRLEFMVDEKTMEKIQKAKSVLSNKYPKGVNLELLFEVLLENYLDHNDPERRDGSDNDIEINKLNRTRHIPQKIKDLVYRRDGGRCSFVSRSGRRCSSRWNLQYDHIVPYGKGGDNSPGNLRLLCARHNQLMARRE